MTADECAKQMGFYGAGDSFDWNGVKCCDVVMTKDPLETQPRIGMPLFMVKEGTGWRSATPQERHAFVFGS